MTNDAAPSPAPRASPATPRGPLAAFAALVLAVLSARPALAQPRPARPNSAPAHTPRTAPPTSATPVHGGTAAAGTPAAPVAPAAVGGECVDCDARWIHAGPSAVPQQGLASGVAIRSTSRPLDIDGDGEPDLVFVVRAAPRAGESEGPLAIVLARHAAAGWTAEVLTTEARAGGAPAFEDIMVAGANRYVLVQSRFARDVADGCAEHSTYVLFRAAPQRPAVAVFSGETRNCAYEEWAFLPRDDGSVMVQSDQGRHRLLRWNSAQGRLEPQAWSQ